MNIKIAFILWNQNLKGEDDIKKNNKEENLSLQKLTMQIFSGIAGSVEAYLKFTWDFLKMNVDKTLPVLDLSAWMGNLDEILRYMS